ncbi:MAG: metal-dependent hydrolase [Betaproteobacteria bacterium]
MDTLTHALSGALLARATAPKDAPPRSIPRRVAAGFFAAAAPDLDFVIGFIGPVEYLLYHRGPTHSVVLLPLWALLLAWILAKILREPRGWRALYGVCALALGAHIVGDLITSFGTIVFAPLPDWRAGLGTTFIIDLRFSAIIVAGLAASALLYRTRLPAVAAGAVLAGYVGFQYLQRQDALEFARSFAVEKGIVGARIEAHPKPLSPFNWTVFVSTPNEHRFAHVNLVRKAPRSYQPGDGFVARLDAPYLPLGQAQWQKRERYGGDLAQEAWQSDALAFFRWFADQPAFDGMSEGSTCAWFVDLRFLTPGRETMPFRYGACRDAPGAPWRLATS